MEVFITGPNFDTVLSHYSKVYESFSLLLTYVSIDY
jgi:hypothetical protein